MQRFKKDSEDKHQNSHNMFWKDEIAPHVKSGPEVRYVVRRYGFSIGDDTAKPSQHIPHRSIDHLWRRLDKKEANGSLGFVWSARTVPGHDPKPHFLPTLAHLLLFLTYAKRLLDLENAAMVELLAKVYSIAQ